MKPPACVRCKWGSGTTCEKQPDTVAAKEVKSNFEKMLAERAKQDSAWFAEPRGEASLFAEPPSTQEEHRLNPKEKSKLSK
jgi:hypothetical protein